MNTRLRFNARRLVMPLLALAALAAGLTGCQSGGPQVQTDYDKSVNFTQYHTFAFQPGRIVSRLGTRDVDNTLVGNRIRDAVLTQLPARGLQPVTQNPDLVVTYIAGAQNRQQVEDLGPSPYDSPFFGGPFFLRHDAAWWGPGYDQFYVRNYTEGTLILDMIDPRTRQLVWRAYVTGEVGKPDEGTINKAVAAALKNFPPKTKS